MVSAIFLLDLLNSENPSSSSSKYYSLGFPVLLNGSEMDRESKLVNEQNPMLLLPKGI